MSIKVKIQEPWYQRLWKPSIAYTYLFLVIGDYALRPTLNYFRAKQFDLTETVQAILPLPPTTQVVVLQNMQKNDMPPILSEFVHIAFGAMIASIGWVKARNDRDRMVMDRFYDNYHDSRDSQDSRDSISNPYNPFETVSKLTQAVAPPDDISRSARPAPIPQPPVGEAPIPVLASLTTKVDIEDLPTPRGKQRKS